MPDETTETTETIVDETSDDLEESVEVPVEVEDKAEDTPTEETEPELTEDDVMNELADRASDAGLTPEDVSDFKTPESLERAINMMERKKADDPDPEPVDDKIDDDSFVVDLDEDLYDADVIKTIKGLNAYWQDKFSKLNGKFSSEQDMAVDRRFDQMISDLGKSHSKLFGDGHSAELDPKATVALNRVQIRDEIKVTEAGRKQRGLDALPEQDLFNRALRSVFGKETEKIARNQMRAEVRKRSGQGLNRPTHRQSNLESGDSKALAGIATYLRNTNASDEGME